MRRIARQIRVLSSLEALGIPSNGLCSQEYVAAHVGDATRLVSASHAGDSGVRRATHRWWELGFTVAGGLAAARLLQPPAQCEAQAGGAAAGAGVEAAVMELWLRLDEQLDRLDASLMDGAPVPRIPAPEVEQRGGRVTVTFRVPQELDVGAALAEAQRLLRSQSRFPPGAEAGGAVTETRRSGPEGRDTRLHRSSRSLGDLFISVAQPRDASQPAVLEFSIEGSVTEGDGGREALELMAAALAAAAARPRGRAPGGGGELGALLGGADGFPFFGGLGAAMGALRELVEEMERGHQDVPWGSPGGGGREVAVEQLPHRRPKRFDELSASERAAADGTAPSCSIFDSPAARRAVQSLRDMGAQVFLPQTGPHAAGGTEAAAAAGSRLEASSPASASAAAAGAARPPGLGRGGAVDWGTLAGYEEQKRSIEDCLLLPLLRPEVYDSVARGTRARFAPNRPRAVLLVGPPGTGKTSSARVIAAQASVPLVYLPLEAFVSKWYGESERQLAEALALCDVLPLGCIVFLDELDALATSRGGEGMHEATRRLLGVLLRHIDGFDTSKRSVVVGATNRPQDLDPALLSRFSATVEFGLPGEATRGAILRQYAHHLGEGDVAVVAAATPGMAGRDLRDVAEQAERRWAAKIIRGQAAEGALPPLEEYLTAAAERARDMAAGAAVRMLHT